MVKVCGVQVIDLLMRIVMIYGMRNESTEHNPVVMVYQVLYSTVTDHDMQSSLYLTKYMDFLQKHIQVKVHASFPTAMSSTNRSTGFNLSKHHGKPLQFPVYKLKPVYYMYIRSLTRSTSLVSSRSCTETSGR